jgi:hypothetical protein
MTAAHLAAVAAQIDRVLNAEINLGGAGNNEKD